MKTSQTQKQEEKEIIKIKQRSTQEAEGTIQ
jgi:hypothetical protein